MPAKTIIPKEFMPFVLYVAEVTPSFVSFNIPNTPENYAAFMKLIEPILHPNIVEIQQPAQGSEHISIKIMLEALTSNLERYMNTHSGHSYSFDPDSALKEARNIINGIA